MRHARAVCLARNIGCNLSAEAVSTCCVYISTLFCTDMPFACLAIFVQTIEQPRLPRLLVRPLPVSALPLDVFVNIVLTSPFPSNPLCSNTLCCDSCSNCTTVTLSCSRSQSGEVRLYGQRGHAMLCYSQGAGVLELCCLQMRLQKKAVLLQQGVGFDVCRCGDAVWLRHLLGSCYDCYPFRQWQAANRRQEDRSSLFELSWPRSSRVYVNVTPS
jgi:hypothetical protein